MIKKIIPWAKSHPNIRAVVLTGSRAKKSKADPYSDYDVSIICKDSKPLLNTQKWLECFGEVWVCISEKLPFGKKSVSTRLVIYERGIKVDFTIIPVGYLKSETRKNLHFSDGFKSLLDKDHLFKQGQKVSTPLIKKPTEKEFQQLIDEFWFETYHIANYLMRGDLWAVKFRDADIKHRLLLKLIQWHESSKKHWKLHALPNGHGMKKWASPRVWNWAHRLFPPFEHEASWRGLIQTIVFFRECAEELSNKLGYRYPAELDRHFTGYLLHLMNQKKSFARKDS